MNNYKELKVWQKSVDLEEIQKINSALQRSLIKKFTKD